tara:strand:+ start:643 stop:2340 length:1698 start_codon:yes stop_codon:yes gene_type:complete
MNKIMLLLVFAIAISACNDKHHISIEDDGFNKHFFNKKNIPIVKGKVLNLSDDEIRKTKLEYTLVTPFEQNQMQISKTSQLNADGSFELEIDYSFPYQQIWLTIGDYFYTGLYANSDLFLEIDTDSIESGTTYFNGPGIKFGGTDREFNLIMNNHILFKRDQQLELSQAIQAIGSLDYAIYKVKYDSLYSVYFQIDDDFIERNPSKFSWLIKNERLSDYYANLCVKHWGKKMDKELLAKIKNHKTYLISNNSASFYNYFLTYLSIQARRNQNLNYEDLKKYSKLTNEEKNTINEYIFINELKERKQPFDSLKHNELYQYSSYLLKDTIFIHSHLKAINLIDSLFDRGKADLFKMKISSNNFANKSMLLETLLNHLQTDWCREIIKKDYNKSLVKTSKINEILKKGQPIESEINIGKPIAEFPFGAKLYRVDEMEPERLLANLKESFKGKALLMDYWATWCGPCLEDFPFSKKLHNEMDNEPIEFIYLCTSSGSDIDKWKSKIIELELGGIHLFVDSKIQTELMNLFSLHGFPSFALIDLKGEFKAGAIQRMELINKEKLLKFIEE